MNVFFSFQIITLGVAYTVAVSGIHTVTQNKTCPSPNEVWNDCGSSCPQYCGEPAAEICNAMCAIGCECRKGFVKDRSTGKCISSQDCAANDPCAKIRCSQCTTCKKDTRNVPHCIPSSDSCCPSSLASVDCFANPCSVNKCFYPNATCISYYCGGCDAHFYDQNWNRLTKELCDQTSTDQKSQMA